MRCAICHQDYKQSDIIDNYFVKDTTEATSTSDEKAAQVPQSICQSKVSTWILSYIHCLILKQNRLNVFVLIKVCLDMDLFW